MTKLLLLDKDGTLVKPRSGNEFVQHPEDQELIPGVAEAIERYAADGWAMAIVSNQGGVSAGYKTLDDAIAEMRYCLKLLPQISTAYFCPDDGKWCHIVRSGNLHQVSSGQHECNGWNFRKPGDGMIKLASRSFNSSIPNLVGDRREDQQAAEAANIPFMWADEWIKTGT